MKKLLALVFCLGLLITCTSAALVPAARKADIAALLKWVPERLSQLTAEYDKVVTKELYGKSEQGRDLELYTLRQPGVERPSAKLLLTFVLHGYEEYFDQDGVYLAQMAVQMMEHYCKHPDQLGDVELLFVPVANPDGMNKKNGSDSWFGRAQSRNIDMNRDFRNGYCMAKESQALRDLLRAKKPQLLLDFHGWLECTIGDKDLAMLMKKHYDLPWDSDGRGIEQGYWTGWAHTQGLRTLLIEFKSVRSMDPEKMLAVMAEIIRGYCPAAEDAQEELPVPVKDEAWKVA